MLKCFKKRKVEVATQILKKTLFFMIFWFFEFQIFISKNQKKKFYKFLLQLSQQCSVAFPHCFTLLLLFSWPDIVTFVEIQEIYFWRSFGGSPQTSKLQKYFFRNFFQNRHSQTFLIGPKCSECNFEASGIMFKLQGSQSYRWIITVD